jgi:glucosamine-6-phosphate deaminase
MPQKDTSTTTIDFLAVEVYDSAGTMGEASAEFVAQNIQVALNDKGCANLIFATGKSQLNFLKALKSIDSIDWAQITTFHLDEYIGIGEEHPASFRKYLHEHIIDIVKPGTSYFLQGDAGELPVEISRYESLLQKHQIDVACIGIGENGHLAFNDPPVADFEDPHWVKVVKLDEKSRQQQVDEGWFGSIEEVPKQALTLTIPAIMRSKAISCVVPDRRKAGAVHNTLYGPIVTDCPASILRTHPNAVLFLDGPAAALLDGFNEKQED